MKVESRVKEVWRENVYWNASLGVEGAVWRNN
jgi:hypothetical protein